MKTKILIVEDDASILFGLTEVLTSEGFEVISCTRGDHATELLKQHQPALILLDVMLPGKSGFELCQELRKSGLKIPILMLTAKGSEMDKVVGLDLGADDYVTKPFGVRELIARIQALLRRSGAIDVAMTDSFRIGKVVIDPRRFVATHGDQQESLTAKELKLLQLFHERKGEVLSRDFLLNAVWGHGYYGTTRTLDQVVVQLRKKLGDPAENPRHIQTVHGVGYRLLG